MLSLYNDVSFKNEYYDYLQPSKDKTLTDELFLLRRILDLTKELELEDFWLIDELLMMIDVVKDVIVDRFESRLPEFIEKEK